MEDADFIEHVEIGQEDTVAFVGHIRPFVPIVKNKAKNLFVLERNPELQQEGVLPDTACEEILPKADVVIITGATLVNGTIDRLLELSNNAREVGLVGPTASILPDVLFHHGVTVTGGIKVKNAEKMFQIIAEGGGTPHFKDACTQIVIRPKVVKLSRQK